LTDKAVAYIRVSSSSQVEGHSLDAQERLYRDFSSSRGWDPIKVYREEGKSAFRESIKSRPSLRQLLEDASKKTFDVVVVYALDRWSRNLKVTLETLALLGRYDVAFVSITENIDYSNPMGRFVIKMLGSIAELYSDSMGGRIGESMQQRALNGKHTGGIPFGYQSCWVEENGERKRRCSTEHPGGIHLVKGEAQGVAHLFRTYARGTTTLSQLAAWLNETGYRTRNTKTLPSPDGTSSAGPKVFTTASVRGILHNGFYAGSVRYKGQWHPGVHEAAISQELYNQVQGNLAKNNGRSRSLEQRPERHYLLKGIIRCAYCLMPMWAQTYSHGNRYYREHRASRSHGICPATGGSIMCDIADEQVGRLVEAIQLDGDWLQDVLDRISIKDEVERVRSERKQVQERLKRLARTYRDGLCDESEYERQKRLMEMELESLVVPEADATEEAGKLVQQLPELWSGATLQERHRLLVSMLEAVYVDHKDAKAVVAIQPKPAFRAVFQVATTRADSGVMLIKEPPDESQKAPSPCSWWRRGRVELPVQGKSSKNVLQA